MNSEPSAYATVCYEWPWQHHYLMSTWIIHIMDIYLSRCSLAKTDIAALHEQGWSSYILDYFVKFRWWRNSVWHRQSACSSVRSPGRGWQTTLRSPSVKGTRRTWRRFKGTWETGENNWTASTGSWSDGRRILGRGWITSLNRCKSGMSRKSFGSILTINEADDDVKGMQGICFIGSLIVLNFKVNLLEKFFRRGHRCRHTRRWFVGALPSTVAVIGIVAVILNADWSEHCRRPLLSSAPLPSYSTLIGPIIAVDRCFRDTKIPTFCLAFFDL